jgi:putative phosphoesterase
MKIAFISDIHANFLAFESVLKDIKKEHVDRIVFLGDASTLGIRPSETLELLESLKCDCILGNHDEFMVIPERIHEYTRDKLVLATVEWSRALHSSRDIEFLRSFKKELRIPFLPGVDIFCYHGSPISNIENVRPDSPMNSFSSLMDESRNTIFIGGHTHVQMLRNYQGTRILTAGSVGQPFSGYEMPPSKEPWAEYVIIQAAGKHFHIDYRLVEIDNERINREIMESDNPMNDFIS